MRPASRHREHEFVIGGGRSRYKASDAPATIAATSNDPKSDSEDDEQDAYLTSIVVESKVSLNETHTRVPNETNQGVDASKESRVSSANTVDVPQGDQDATRYATPAMVVDTVIKFVRPGLTRQLPLKLFNTVGC